MQTTRIFFGKLGGQVIVGGRCYELPPNCIAMTYGDAALSCTVSECDLHSIDIYPADFHSLYVEIVDLLPSHSQQAFFQKPLHMVSAQPDLISILQLLAQSSRAAFLRFAYVYCLGMDRPYFAEFLRQAINSDQLFIEFVHNNFLKPWSVEQFAEQCGMPVRKFNLLFQKKYGASAKRWLLDKRLAYAAELLLTTSMRVLDIALECGFSNHAHFTDSFRKHFFCSPSEYRQGREKNQSHDDDWHRKEIVTDNLALI